MSDIELIYRCLGIILESIAFGRDNLATAEDEIARKKPV
jgi:hypothetical protein